MTINESGIRPYGPGKFDTILDSYIYDLSLDGSDSECGSVDEHGVCYSLLNGPSSSWFKDGDPFQEELTEDERAFLDEQAGAILWENSDGFVSIDYYTDDAELAEAWRACEYEIARMDHEAEANGDETDGAA